MAVFLLSERARAEGVFLWAGVQVPSLVSKYVRGLDGGVEEQFFFLYIYLREHGFLGGNARRARPRRRCATFEPRCEFTLPHAVRLL